MFYIIFFVKSLLLSWNFIYYTFNQFYTDLWKFCFKQQHYDIVSFCTLSGINKNFISLLYNKIQNTNAPTKTFLCISLVHQQSFIPAITNYTLLLSISGQRQPTCVQLFLNLLIQPFNKFPTTTKHQRSSLAFVYYQLYVVFSTIDKNAKIVDYNTENLYTIQHYISIFFII